MLGNYLQQTTSADNIFKCSFFLGVLRVKISNISYPAKLDRLEKNSSGAVEDEHHLLIECPKLNVSHPLISQDKLFHLQNVVRNFLVPSM